MLAACNSNSSSQKKVLKGFCEKGISSYFTDTEFMEPEFASAKEKLFSYCTTTFAPCSVEDIGMLDKAKNKSDLNKLSQACQKASKAFENGFKEVFQNTMKK